MLYALIIILRGIKILRAKISTSDMPRTWNLHKFTEVRLRLLSLFVSLVYELIFVYHSCTSCIFRNQGIKNLTSSMVKRCLYFTKYNFFAAGTKSLIP